MSRLNFKLEKTATGSRARAARFRTLHNEVLTPLFMPVGTHATVRSQRFEDLLGSGSQILLANTYHLLLRPGPEVFDKFGGIHNFMKWPKSVLTDSGGFQIFAMPNDRAMSEEGAKFLSYVDGKHILLTPEKSIATQKSIGSDIMMVLDQCVPSTVEHSVARAAMELSNRWALRSLAARGDSPQSMFAIVQGACYEDLRKESAAFLSQHPFDGFALGGLAVGESKQEREDTVGYAAAMLPSDRPRYLMGVGTPIDLLEAVHRGMDMFDCIIPTAHAEQGVAYTWRGKVLLRRGVYKDRAEPIDKDCACSVCQTYSRAYLHQLIKTGEPLGRQLVGQHNIHFYHVLMRSMREHILADTFLPFYNTTREYLAASDADFPVNPPKVNKEVKLPMELGDFEVHQYPPPATFANIRQKSSGEIMHPTFHPDIEAKELYVEQSRLVDLAKRKELVVWDVGLGAGHNAMAAIRALEATAGESIPGVQLVSFENDMDAFRLALQRMDLFHHLRHGGPQTLLASGEWVSKKVPLRWTLLEGDFYERLVEAPTPDIVFFDMFSHKSESNHWTVEALELLREQLGDHDVELFTYSTSTAVRASFLAAGFRVAKGGSTGNKRETTIALNGKLQGRELLGVEWFEKWKRSGAREPFVGEQGRLPEMIERIERHVQFS
jgi:queuine tRNA-ribosyltransferase